MDLLVDDWAERLQEQRRCQRRAVEFLGHQPGVTSTRSRPTAWGSMSAPKTSDRLQIQQRQESAREAVRERLRVYDMFAVPDSVLRKLTHTELPSIQ